MDKKLKKMVFKALRKYRNDKKRYDLMLKMNFEKVFYGVKHPIIDEDNKIKAINWLNANIKRQKGHRWSISSQYDMAFYSADRFFILFESKDDALWFKISMVL